MTEQGWTAVAYKEIEGYRLCKQEVGNGLLVREGYRITRGEAVLLVTANPFYAEGALRGLAAGQFSEDSIPAMLPGSRLPGWEGNLPWIPVDAG